MKNGLSICEKNTYKMGEKGLMLDDNYDTLGKSV